MRHKIYLSKKTSSSLAKLFKVKESEIIDNAHLFTRIDPYMAKCFEYLAQIEDDKLKTSAALSLNYLINYGEAAFGE